MTITASSVLAYRVIVSDLDGTLLNNAGQISARTQAAVEEVRYSGAKFIIATARPLPDAIAIARDLALTDPIICQNGAIIACTPNLEDVWKKFLISRSILGRVIDTIRRASSDAQVAIDYPFYRLADPGWSGPSGSLIMQYTLWPLTGRELPKIRAAASVMIRNAKFDEITLAQFADVTVTSSSHGLIEISRRGVDKAAALRRVCKLLEVAPELVVSFGDMTNDLAMLQYTGLGVAVSNATDIVRHAADMVAPSNEQDGVATVLEQLLLDGRIGSEPGMIPQ
jgi:5-amino-6-(5-phospho-D-ribitylamino)uracil phosphatase